LSPFSKDIHTLALAGGGNRCWWQAGALSRLMREGWQLPPMIVGTSAGAAIAASCLTTGPEAALEACKDLYKRTANIFNWRGVLRGRLEFAHQTVYPLWLSAFVNEGTFDSLRSSVTSLQVAITRPSRYLGLRTSVALGTLAYLVDKKVWHSVHPRLPKFFGLQQEFIDVTRSTSAAEVRSVLAAAAAPPPIMQAQKIDDRWAFDGGYTDNAPIPHQSSAQRASTLVMLTRHYRSRPSVFKIKDRTYWQPSRPVPVSTWDCTYRATVAEAFELGSCDAEIALAALTS
jgi:predicted acylesterase/phospholipase RssA